MSRKEPILVANILSPHGVKGLLKVRHYCDSDKEFARLSPFFLEGGRQLSLKISGGGNECVICKIDGVETREAAELLKSKALYKNREDLPEAEAGIYQSDIIGLQCFLANGEKFGEVVAFHNFGASDILEVKPENGDPQMFAFTETNFPEIDIEGGKITINPPEEED